MFAEHPLVGGGWAMFQLCFPELQAQHVAAHPEMIGYWTHTSQLHNDPLQILYEAGALGLASLGWLLWRYAREVREVASAGDRRLRLWLGASAGGVTAILVNSLFNFQLAIPPTLILLFTLLAFPGLLRPSLLNKDSRVADEKSLKRYLFLKILATFVVVLAASLFTRGIWTRAAGDRALALGMEQERKGDYVRAEVHFRGGLARSAEDGRLHYGLARALFVQTRHAEALAEVLRAERTVADAHLEVLRARILDQMGQPSHALAAYRHALWLDPRLKSVPADIERLTGGEPEAVQ
jgi:tetratricopeptide (TPR) repeat protein